MASETIVEKGLAGVDEIELKGDHGHDGQAVMGTTKLNEDELLLIPAPSADPRGKCCNFHYRSSVRSSD
jgi:hypothetical protein